MLFPSHTNATLFDKAVASAIWQYADKYTKFSVRPFTILANLRLHLGDVEMTQLVWLTGTVTENSCAHG